MINLIVIPCALSLGALTANLTDFARGETAQRFPQLSLGSVTLTLAVISYTVMWFALLVSGIYSSDGEGFFAGMELLAVFAIGLAVYSFTPLKTLISQQAQIWLFRLALPMIVLSTFFIVMSTK
ncbi:MAG: hypothetical protein ACRCT7_07670 [Shewanella sp.]